MNCRSSVRIACFGLAISALLSFGSNAETVRRPPDPPSPVGLKPGPLYVNQDSSGNLFHYLTPSFDIREQASARKHYLSDSDLKALQGHAAKNGYQIQIVPEVVDQSSTDGGVQAKSSGSCPVPSSFYLSQADASSDPAGARNFLTTNKGTGETTQWAVIVFHTADYSTAQAHTIVPLLYHDNTLHGSGAIFGDNSGGFDGCAGDHFNTQLEAFAVWERSYHEPDPNDCNDPGPPPTGCHPDHAHGYYKDYHSGTDNAPFNYWWQNKVWATSCGSSLYNNTTYALTIQANTSQDVAYDVQRWNGSAYVPHTSWTAKNPTTPNWEWYLASAFVDTSYEGIFMGSTKATGAFTISVDSFDCGWF